MRFLIVTAITLLLSFGQANAFWNNMGGPAGGTTDDPLYNVAVDGTEENGDSVAGPDGTGTVYSTAANVTYTEADSGEGFEITSTDDVVSIDIGNIDANSFDLQFKFKSTTGTHDYGQFVVLDSESDAQLYRYNSNTATRYNIDSVSTIIGTLPISGFDGASHTYLLQTDDTSEESRLYQDGFLVYNTASSWPTGTISPTADISFGNLLDGTRPIGGLIADVKIADYNTYRTLGYTSYGDSVSTSSSLGRLIPFTVPAGGMTASHVYLYGYSSTGPATLKFSIFNSSGTKVAGDCDQDFDLAEGAETWNGGEMTTPVFLAAGDYTVQALASTAAIRYRYTSGCTGCGYADTGDTCDDKLSLSAGSYTMMAVTNWEAH